MNDIAYLTKSVTIIDHEMGDNSRAQMLARVKGWAMPPKERYAVITVQIELESTGDVSKITEKDLAEKIAMLLVEQKYSFTPEREFINVDTSSSATLNKPDHEQKEP